MAGSAEPLIPSGRAPDPRKVRTIARLRCAAMELLGAEGRTGVTVSELVKHARVSRAAFYLHYDDVESVLDDALGAELRDISKAAEGAHSPGFAMDPAAPAQNILAFFRHVDRHIRLYRWVFSENGSARIQANLLKGFIEIAAEGAEHYPKRRGASDLRVARTAAFFGGAIFGVLHEWLHSANPGDPDDVAGWLWRRFVDFDRIANAEVPEPARTGADASVRLR